MATSPSGGRLSSEWSGWPVGVILGGVVLLGLLSLGVSVAEVASPSTAQAQSADAVMVHVGREARLDVGLELVEAGVAPVLVVSAVGSEYDRGNVAMEALCEREKPFKVLCPVTEPASTIGEARAFGRLADKHGWETVAVVTSRGHLTRAPRGEPMHGCGGTPCGRGLEPRGGHGREGVAGHRGEPPRCGAPAGSTARRMMIGQVLSRVMPDFGAHRVMARHADSYDGSPEPSGFPVTAERGSHGTCLTGCPQVGPGRRCTRRRPRLTPAARSLLSRRCSSWT